MASAVASAGQHLNSLPSTDLYDMTPDDFDKFIVSVIMGAYPWEPLHLPSTRRGFEAGRAAAIRVFESTAMSDMATWNVPMFHRLVQFIMDAYDKETIPF